VIVSGSLYRIYDRNAGFHSVLDRTTLAERPTTGDDAVRVVNQLPGSASVGVSARPRVRGGREDETLILFDGVRLYEPFHFNGFNDLYSGFDARLIDRLDFYSGGFPVEYGDRLSAAMVMETRDVEESSRELGLSLYNVSWLQTSKDKDSAWVFDVRRGTIDLLAQLAEKDPGSPAFADAFARYAWQTTDGDRLSVNFLWLGDDMQINNSSQTESATSLYNSAYAWLSWERDWNDAFYSRTWFSVATLLDDRYGLVDKPGIVTGTLENERKFRFYDIKQSVEYTPARDWLIKFGWNYKYVTGQYDYDGQLDVAAPFDDLSNFARAQTTNIDLDQFGFQSAVWASLRTNITRYTTIEFGARLDAQDYENAQSASQVNPRFNFLITPDDTLEIRLGWGEFSQSEGIHELQVSDNVTHYQPPQESAHLIAGIRKTLPGGTELRLETYRKRGHQTGIYFENLTNSLTLLPELAPDRVVVAADSYIAEGIEFSATGKFRQSAWWANYSYSSVKDHLPEGNIHRSWDQTNTLNAGFSVPLHDWQFSLSFAWHDGWLTTPLYFDGSEVQAGPRNSERLGAYASLDAKLSRNWTNMRLDAGITNLTNRENVLAYDYTLDGTTLTRTEKPGLPLAPFFSFYWRF
ncbi:MAG: TonB-dependent receptor plug domain-containing protein, partial [Pseudomonadales bacterium]|nr:TonB-dependent receptor plug domain-containing protein [Pseudomonadales bacterium]